MTLQILKTGLFNTNSYNNPDRRYDSFDFVKTTSFNHNGYVAGKEGEFAVTLQSGLTIDVNKGIYNIEGHYVENDTILTFNLLPAQSGKERYDIVILGVTRESTTTIDGESLSREGYIRIIEGQVADIGSANIPFASIIEEDFGTSSGTKEVELAIVKVVSGAIAEVIDKRVSTTTPKVETFITKEIVSNTIDLSEYKLQTQFNIDSNGVLIGSGSDLIGKCFEFRIENLLIDSIVNNVILNINGLEVSVGFTNFYSGFQNGNQLFRIELYVDGGVLLFKHVFNPNLGLGYSVATKRISFDPDLLGYEFRMYYPNVLKENKVIEGSNDYFLSTSIATNRLDDVIIASRTTYVHDGKIYAWGIVDRALAGNTWALAKFDNKGNLKDVVKTFLVHNGATSNIYGERYEIRNIIDDKTVTGIKYRIGSTFGNDKMVVRAIVMKVDWLLGTINTVWESDDLYSFEIEQSSNHNSIMIPFATKIDGDDFATLFHVENHPINGSLVTDDYGNTAKTFLIKRVGGEYSVEYRNTVKHGEFIINGAQWTSEEMDVFGNFYAISTNGDGVGLATFQMNAAEGDEYWEIMKFKIGIDSTIDGVEELVYSATQGSAPLFREYGTRTYIKKDIIG